VFEKNIFVSHCKC